MNYLGISYDYKNKPLLDESFLPFGVWARAYLEKADRPFRVALEREAAFYDLRYLLVLGRVASGVGGDLLIEECNRILREEYPELSAKITVMLPDEKARRVGQSIAAASLPEV